MAGIGSSSGKHQSSVAINACATKGRVFTGLNSVRGMFGVHKSSSMVRKLEPSKSLLPPLMLHICRHWASDTAQEDQPRV